MASERDEETKAITVVQRQVKVDTPPGGDCLVVIYSKDEQPRLGKRFVLDMNHMRVGRGSDNHVVLEGGSVSRRHAFFEQRENIWYIVDDDSTNGTYVNDVMISKERPLANGDRVKIGPTIFKYLTGQDVETQYHEEIYRSTIIDGLTGAYLKRFFFESLEKEIARARRYERQLSLVMFDIDHFRKINADYGHLAGDHVLKELAQVVQSRVRRDEVFSRYGGEEFTIILPETDMPGAYAFAEDIRKRVAEKEFTFQGEIIPVTISVGVALLTPNDQTGQDLVHRADLRLFSAKDAGRNCVMQAE